MRLLGSVVSPGSMSILPNELLEEIFYFADHADLKLVCKTWYHLSKRNQYARVLLDERSLTAILHQHMTHSKPTILNAKIQLPFMFNVYGSLLDTVQTLELDFNHCKEDHSRFLQIALETCRNVKSLALFGFEYFSTTNCILSASDFNRITCLKIEGGGNIDGFISAIKFTNLTVYHSARNKSFIVPKSIRKIVVDQENELVKKMISHSNITSIISRSKAWTFDMIESATRLVNLVTLNISLEHGLSLS